MTARSIFLLLCVIIVIFLLIFRFTGFENIKKIAENLGVAIGRLTVPGVSPQVITVYLEDNLCDEPGGANQPRVSPLENSYRQIRFNATVYDINGDCNGTATFYICMNETAVGPTFCSADYSVQAVNVPGAYAQYGGSSNNLYCNFTATYDLPYFRKCGNWYVNVTAFDVEGHSNSTVRWWKDNLLGAVGYPYSNGIVEELVYMGTVILGQWNLGMGQNWTKNTGNVNITSLVWNATNFTLVPSGAGVIPIIPFQGNTTFAVDDDTNIMNGAGYINERPSVQIQFPSYGLYRCEDFGCTSSRAMYRLWWHIYVPSVPSGIYENTIQYDILDTLTCD